MSKANGKSSGHRWDASQRDQTRRSQFLITPAQKDAWIRQVLKDPNLPASASKVAMVIALHVNRNTGDAWPSIPTIAAAIAMSRRTVLDMLNRLERRNHLGIDRGGGRHVVNHYRMKENDAETCTDSEERNGAGEDTETESNGVEALEQMVKSVAETVQPAPQTVKAASPEPLNEPHIEPHEQKLATAHAVHAQKSSSLTQDRKKKNVKGRRPSLIRGILNQDIKAEVFKIFDEAKRDRPNDTYLVDTWVARCSEAEWAERGWTIGLFVQVVRYAVRKGAKTLTYCETIIQEAHLKLKEFDRNEYGTNHEAFWLAERIHWVRWGIFREETPLQVLVWSQACIKRGWDVQLCFAQVRDDAIKLGHVDLAHSERELVAHYAQP